MTLKSRVINNWSISLFAVCLGSWQFFFVIKMGSHSLFVSPSSLLIREKVFLKPALICTHSLLCPRITKWGEHLYNQPLLDKMIKLASLFTYLTAFKGALCIYHTCPSSLLYFWSVGWEKTFTIAFYWVIWTTLMPFPLLSFDPSSFIFYIAHNECERWRIPLDADSDSHPKLAACVSLSPAANSRFWSPALPQSNHQTWRWLSARCF